MKIDNIQDNEELYRSIPMNYDNMNPNNRGYSYNELGELEIRSPAFNDREREPSVDRAFLKNFDPALSQDIETDGIVTLIAGMVCKLKVDGHDVYVTHDPVPDNPAHSKIVMKSKNTKVSKNKQDKAFRTLRRMLADLAQESAWTLKPPA